MSRITSPYQVVVTQGTANNDSVTTRGFVDDKTTIIYDKGNDHTGFYDLTTSTIAFVDGTRTFSISPTGTDFSYYIKGVLYTATGDSIIIANTEGIHLIYYDGSVLTEIVGPSDAQIKDVILTKAIVAYVFWDATNSKGKLYEERHGMTMSGMTHAYLHFTFGTQYGYGLALNSLLVDQTGNLDSHAQFGTDLGAILDEDLTTTLTAITSTTGLEIWYLSGSDWRWTTNAGFSILTTGSGRMAYNSSGTQVEVPNNNFALCHVFATNNVDGKPIAIQGQAFYGNITAAREGATTELGNLILAGLPEKEFKAIATVIFQTSNTYTNSVKSRTRSTDLGADYIDWRRTPLNATIPASNHSSLSGLSNDDHLQYVLLAGRSGGQDIIGGTVASDDLTLESTSDVTKGSVVSKDNLEVQGDIEVDKLVGLSTSTTFSFDKLTFDTSVSGFTTITSSDNTNLIVIDSSASSSILRLDRGATNQNGNIEFHTGGVVKWVAGLPSDGTDNFEISGGTAGDIILTAGTTSGDIKLTAGDDITVQTTSGSGIISWLKDTGLPALTYSNITDTFTFFDDIAVSIGGTIEVDTINKKASINGVTIEDVRILSGDITLDNGTLNGGRTASDDLTLQSTSDSTKGSIILQDMAELQAGHTDNITTVNAATYDLLITDYILHVTYTTTGAVTSLTLPSAQVVSGRVIHIKDAGGNAGTNNITIDTEGSETIDGSATLVINSDYVAVSLYSDGSNWFIF